MEYKLSLKKKQTEVIQMALEEFFRLRMNQTMDFADSICFAGFDYANHEKVDFDSRIQDREDFESKLGVLLRQYNKYDRKTEDMLIAEDIWRVIRHTLYLDNGGSINDWCVAADIPRSASGMELPKLEKIDE